MMKTATALDNQSIIGTIMKTSVCTVKQLAIVNKNNQKKSAGRCLGFFYDSYAGRQLIRTTFSAVSGDAAIFASLK